MNARHIALWLLSLEGATAWISSQKFQVKPHTQLFTSSSSKSDIFQSDEVPSSSSPETSRRQWLFNIASASVTAGCFPLLPADAANLVSTTSVCDPAVSVWKRDGRIVYLLGTAHISSASAEVAGSLVRDIHPNGVFVELDPKRVRGSGILAKKMEGDNTPDYRVVVPQIYASVSTAPSPAAQLADGGTAVAALPSSAPPPPQTSNSNPLMKAASKAVGNSIKGMYKKLDSAGFQAGEEFVVAMREGQKIGSDIVLGDRDVEVTLRRLTEALAQTDLKMLLSPDSELEQSMKELLPSQSIADGTDLTDEQFREEFSNFVEIVKTKENVRKVMGQLNRVAPALYQALVSERDAYMAAGLNGLNELETIVAVMGIAHVDGVEQNLKMNGWKAVQPTCAKI